MSIWRPGPRPNWVRRFNALGEPAWIPIDGKALLEEAQARTGLSDFGGDSWREGFANPDASAAGTVATTVREGIV